ncbi:MAG: PhoH family protein [Deltaproteobacteria bacterium]|nr:PhoH family protein [Deltaproteobacteria bacterium]
MKKKENVIRLNFADNNLARNLFGPHESHLKSLESQIGVDIHVRGGEVSIEGDSEKAHFAENVLNQLYDLMKKGHPIMGQDIERAIRILNEDKNASLHQIFLDSVFIPSRRKVIYPRSAGQKLYVEAIRGHDMVFGVGPAGTGKTYLAMAMAVTALLKGEVKRIILTRPAIEAGEKLGFLPGDLIEKVNPYLRPLYDAMHDMLDFDKTQKMLDRGDIEVAPLAFMRGRTLNDAFVILDEAQNTTVEQMRMFLTRIGVQSKAVITGDVTQIDLPPEKKSGLIHAIRILTGIPQINIHYLDDRDVVRHPVVREIIKAYAEESISHEKNN